MAVNAQEIPTLGYHAELGMLYNMATDNFLQGGLLWNATHIQKHIHVDKAPDVKSSVTVGDSLNSKAEMFNMKASLKASFLGGLVRVGGSASVLNDHRTSKNRCSVILRHEEETEYHHVDVKEMADAIDPEVVKDQSATHVVIGVHYGAKAYMVFSKVASNNESKLEISGKLEATVRKFGTVSGSVEMGLSQEEKDQISNITFEYYGDVRLPTMPTNIQSAMSMSKQIPGLIKAAGLGEVVRVALYPLAEIEQVGARVAKVVNDIPKNIAEKMQKVHLDLKEVEIRTKDLTKMCEDLKVDATKDKLNKFQIEVKDYTILLKANLRKVLPLVRLGNEPMQKLEDVLEFHEESVFSGKQMHKWLDEKENEIKTLKKLTEDEKMKDYPIVPGSALPSKTSDVLIKWLYVMSFTSLEDKEPYLSTLSEYNEKEEFEKMENISVARKSITDLEKNTVAPWYNRSRAKRRVKAAYDEFVYQAPGSGCKGIITYKSDSSAPGAKLNLYNHGEHYRQDV